MVYRLKIRVYYEDTDAGGIAYHAAYLRFAERARTEALREAGAPHSALVAEHGLMLVVRRLETRYVRPARLDDLVTVETETLSVGGATVRLRQRVRDDAGTLAVLAVELACVRVAEGRPARLPDRWRGVLERVPEWGPPERGLEEDRDAD